MSKAKPKKISRSVIKKNSSPYNTFVLPPILKRYFDLQLANNDNHFQINLLFKLPLPFDIKILKTAATILLVWHDTLRLRCTATKDPETARLFYCNQPSSFGIPITKINLDKNKANYLKSYLNRAKRFSLTKGPLAKIYYLCSNNNSQTEILFVVHHFVCDGASSAIITNDLIKIYSQLYHNLPVSLPPKTAPYKEWTEKLVALSRAEIIQNEKKYWLDVLEGQLFPAYAITNRLGTVTHNDMHRMKVKITTLEKIVAHHISGKIINAILLAALLMTANKLTGQENLLFHSIHSGRKNILDDCDISRTVGWFSTVVPTKLTLLPNIAENELISNVMSQYDNIPNYGIGFSLLKYFSAKTKPTTKKLYALDKKIKCIFNYYGSFSKSLPDFSVQLDKNNEAEYHLDIAIYHTEKHLEASVYYSTKHYNVKEINEILAHFKAGVANLLAIHERSLNA